ncbi:MAG: hypothetical protein ABW252_03570 [Polyangiales bacterium]
MQRTLRDHWACALALTALLSGCPRDPRGANDGGDAPHLFPSTEQAVQQAKRDLVDVLRMDGAVSLGLDPAMVERATPGLPVERVEVDFAQLLAADGSKGLDALGGAPRSTVVPLMFEQRAITIVEVESRSNGVRVVGLAGQDIARDLTQLDAVGDPRANRKVTLYEVPNLQARIYGVRTSDDPSERYFTTYRGRFALTDGVSADALVPVLRDDALAFQREYGERLKRERLVR